VNPSGPSLRPEKQDSGVDNSWLETYADTITLLMAFFVMMFSMSQLDEGKFKVLKEAISTEISKRPPAGKGPHKDDSLIDLPQPDVLKDVKKPEVVPPEQRASASKSSADQLKAQPGITKLSEQGLLKIDTTDGLKIEFASKALFASGNADVKDSMQEILDEVGRVLADGRFSKIDIEGHTDDQAIHTARFPSNWELSASRATSVARALLALHPIDPKKLRPSGFADTRPAMELDSDEAQEMDIAEVRARNRRVVIHAQY